MQSRTNFLFPLGALVAALLFAAAVSADVVTLKTGEIVLGTVQEESAEGVVIETHVGTTQIPLENIERVEYEDASVNEAPASQPAEEPLTVAARVVTPEPNLVWYEGELLRMEVILSRLTDATTARNAAERTLADQAGEIARLESQVKSRSKHIARLEREESQRERELDSVYADLREAEGSSRALRATLHDRDDEITALRRDLDHANHELYEAQHKVKKLRQRLHHARDHWRHDHYHSAACGY